MRVDFLIDIVLEWVFSISDLQVLYGFTRFSFRSGGFGFAVP